MAIIILIGYFIAARFIVNLIGNSFPKAGNFICENRPFVFIVGVAFLAYKIAYSGDVKAIGVAAPLIIMAMSLVAGRPRF